MNNTLREARKRAKMSQQQVAEALGWGRRTYIRYENGQRNVTPTKAYALAELLDIDPTLLLLSKNLVDLESNPNTKQAFRSFLKNTSKAKDSILTVRIATPYLNEIRNASESLGLSIQDTVLLAFEVLYDTLDSVTMKS